jgi:hypothetical protein
MSAIGWRLPLPAFGAKMDRFARPPMVSAPPPPGGLDARPRRGRRPWGWKTWLGLGLFVGLGYGLTQRLLLIPLGDGWRGSQNFGVKPFPGNELEGLRRRFGVEGQEIRGDLDLLELEAQEKRQKAEIDKRQAEMAERERLEEERRQRAADRARLEGLEEAPTSPEPPAAALPPLETPELPPMSPSPPQSADDVPAPPALSEPTADPTLPR